MNISAFVSFHLAYEKSFRITEILIQNIGSSKEERNEVSVAKFCSCSHVLIHILKIFEFVIIDLTQKSVFRNFRFFLFL